LKPSEQSEPVPNKSVQRTLPILAVLVIMLLFIGTLGFLWKQGQDRPEEVQTESPEIRDIVRKTVATGAIVPRNEVAIKPQVSGLVSLLHVEPGETVERGDLLAEIQVVPDSGQLANASSSLSASRIRLAEAEREEQRVRSMVEKGAVSKAALDEAITDLALAKESLRGSQDTLSIIRKGAAAGGGEVRTQVRATVAGMILSVPVKEGQSVIEANTFNEGTTIAEIADMTDLIFQGTVDESEVGQISEGLPLSIKIGAYPDKRFEGVLEYIAPKGLEEGGAVLFEIKAAVTEQGDTFVRAGVSANADIVLEKREQVLTINEASLLFEDGATFVEVQGAQEGFFEKSPVELGLSDGIRTEVLDGVSTGQVIKRQ